MRFGHFFLLALCFASSYAHAGLARVMSVDSGASLTLVEEGGRSHNVQLQGVVLPSQAEALPAARKRLSDRVLAKLVRYELQADGQARLWIGARDINAELSLPPIVASTSRITTSVPTTPPDNTQARVEKADTAQITSSSATLDPVAEALPVIADRHDGVYHRAGCPGYSRVAARQRIEFATVRAAENEGYRRAGNCPAL